ncbi:50S ribosomal protein L25 [compost metagenome]
MKQGGGEVSHTISEVEVSCQPQDLPEFIEVDLAKVEVGQTVHLSDLKLPKGIELVALAHGNDLAVANVHASRVVKEEGEAE